MFYLEGLLGTQQYSEVKFLKGAVDVFHHRTSNTLENIFYSKVSVVIWSNPLPVFAKKFRKQLLMGIGFSTDVIKYSSFVQLLVSTKITETFLVLRWSNRYVFAL